MIIPDKVKILFEEQSLVAFATADKEGTPNIVPVFWKKISGEDTILLIDNFMKMSKNNILENNKVCISFWNLETEEGYKLKGTANYHTRGVIYEEGKRFIQSKKPEKIPKGIIEVKVTEIYIITPGLEAGKKY